MLQRITERMIRIADLPVDWRNDDGSFVQGFVSEAEEQPVISISFPGTMQECHSVQYTDKVCEHFLRGTKGDILFADSDWTHAESYYLSESDNDFALALAAICSRFSYHDALLAHASFIRIDHKGILFTGFSGVGKTTQAELWKKYRNAEIVNGDKAFVREIDSEFFAYGLPWKGSSCYCINEKAPLSAVVVLRKSTENRISLLGKNAMEYFMPHIFFPHWDKACLNKALDTFDHLLKAVPVYLLECRPDEEAVSLTYNTIFG